MPSFWKQPKGQHVLEREQKRKDAAALEKREKQAVRSRDGGCRWPVRHRCLGGMEAAHVRDASLGGSMSRRNMIWICSLLHRRGPESIHGKQLMVVATTIAGADGPLEFYRKGEDGAFYGNYILDSRGD